MRVSRSQGGMALITGLLLLIVVTIIGLAMFRSMGIQEKIASNTREKNRALSAAVSAQQFAENWIATGNATPAGTCTGALVSSTIGQVCFNPPDNGFTAPPWTIGGQPAGVTLDSFGQATSQNSPSFGTYYQNPRFYVMCLGVNGSGTIYQIDAVGWGATPDSVAVVESTYSVQQSGTAVLSNNTGNGSC